MMDYYIYYKLILDKTLNYCILNEQNEMKSINWIESEKHKEKMPRRENGFIQKLTPNTINTNQIKD